MQKHMKFRAIRRKGICVARVVNTELSHWTCALFGQRTHLYFTCSRFEGHVPSWIALTNDLSKAFDFTGFDGLYITDFLPRLISSRHDYMLPHVQKIFGFDVSGFGIC